MLIGSLAFTMVQNKFDISTVNAHAFSYFLFSQPADGKHTVFGQVLGEGSMLTVRKCEAVPVNGTEPRIPLRVVQCGEL